MGRIVTLGGALACVVAGCRYESHVATSAPATTPTVELTPEGELIRALAWADLDADGVDDLAIVDLLPVATAAEARPRVRLFAGSRAASPPSRRRAPRCSRRPSRPSTEGSRRP